MMVRQGARISGTREVSGVWLRTVGESVQVLVEVDGSWRLLIDEPRDGNISHIVEPHGIDAAPLDRIPA